VAIQISYANAYLKPPGSLLVGAPGTGNWTILVWMRPPGVFATYNRTIWYLNNNHALRTNPSGQLQFVYGAGSDTIATLSAATWYCIAVSKQGTTAAKYYLNGVYQSQRTTSLSNSDTAAATIGAWNGAQDWLFATMSNLKVWDAVLTDAEIAAESAVLRPVRGSSLRAWYPFIYKTSAEYTQDRSGNGRHLTQFGIMAPNPSLPEPPVGYGAPVRMVTAYEGNARTVFPTPGKRIRRGQTITLPDGSPLELPLIEMAVDTDATGRYITIVPASRIRAVNANTGFKGLHKYLSDNASATLELRNDDGAYTGGGGLFTGMWAQVRLAGTGELLFTGRITNLTPGYGVSAPYLGVTLDTLRKDLDVPAQSVLLKNTDTRAAALALVRDVPLNAPAGEMIWDYSNWDEATWAGDGSDSVRTYGDVWTGLAAAGGYGKSDGDLDVLTALADLMTAEDGRAVWGRDNKLELYSRQYLDDARDGDVAATLTDDEIVAMPMSIGSQYVNDVVVRWTPTRWQAGATVYTYEPDNPASIKPGEFQEFNVRFRVTGSDRVLAAESLSVVVTSSGGSVSWVWTKTPNATGGTLRVSNGGADAASLSKIAITGSALIASDAVEERRQSLLEQTLYGLKSLTVKATLVDRATEAAARADREFTTWNERATYAPKVTLKPRSRESAVQWMTLPFATPVQLRSARMAHDARYLVMGVDWKVGEGGVPVDVSLTLEPVVSGGFLTWDDDVTDRGLWDSGRWAF
jgi:hypothetical protein